MKLNDLSAIAHDPDAFEAFYREHVEALERFIARRVSNPYLAADLTADAFVAAIEAAAAYRSGRGTPRAWLFGIARNVVASDLRRSKRERDAQERLQGHELLTADDIERMQERIDAAAQSRRLFAAIKRLPTGERAVLELVALDGLSASSAAAALGIRPVTARVRLHRARTTLRRENFDDSSAISNPMEAL